jgi:hypothetical protein
MFDCCVAEPQHNFLFPDSRFDGTLSPQEVDASTLFALKKRSRFIVFFFECVFQSQRILSIVHEVNNSLDDIIKSRNDSYTSTNRYHCVPYVFKCSETI